MEVHKIMEHADIVDKLDGHEERIRNIELLDATTSEQIKNLCEKVSGLVKAIWFLGTSIFVALGGFFIEAHSRRSEVPWSQAECQGCRVV